MAISFQNALGLYESALSLRAERASVLSGNLANVNTPNYKARDMDFKTAIQTQTNNSGLSFKLKSTHNGHIDFSQVEGMGYEKLYRTPTQPSIDGNTVEEQVEHAEFMKNSLEFQASFTLLNGRFKGLTKAITGE